MASEQTQSAPSSQGSRGTRIVALALGLLIGTGIGLLIGALAFDGDEDAPEVAGLPNLDTTLQRIVTEPEQFVGEDVAVGGEVREIISPHAFTVGQLGFFGPDLLVVTKEPLTAPTRRSGSRPVLEGDDVTVSGGVGKFDIASFERDLDINLRREFDSFVGDDLEERRGDPAVRAESVTFASSTTPVVEARTAEEVVERPTDFYGRIVSLSGEVTDVLRSGVVIVDDRLVALTADFGERRPRKGERVRVLGPVRPFDPDQLSPGGKSLPDDDLLGDLAKRPAVVAQSIEVER